MQRTLIAVAMALLATNATAAWNDDPTGKIHDPTQGNAWVADIDAKYFAAHPEKLKEEKAMKGSTWHDEKLFVLEESQKTTDRDKTDCANGVLGISSITATPAEVEECIGQKKLDRSNAILFDWNHNPHLNCNPLSKHYVNARQGMTEHQVGDLTCMGIPSHINTTMVGKSTHEQWVYEDPNGIPTEFLYFTNGRLTGIQISN